MATVNLKILLNIDTYLFKTRYWPQDRNPKVNVYINEPHFTMNWLKNLSNFWWCESLSKCTELTHILKKTLSGYAHSWSCSSLRAQIEDRWQTHFCACLGQGHVYMFVVKKLVRNTWSMLSCIRKMESRNASEQAEFSPKFIAEKNYQGYFKGLFIKSSSLPCLASLMLYALRRDCNSNFEFWVIYSKTPSVAAQQLIVSQKTIRVNNSQLCTVVVTWLVWN